jgi:hypothetical protein
MTIGLTSESSCKWAHIILCNWHEIGLQLFNNVNRVASKLQGAAHYATRLLMQLACNSMVELQASCIVCGRHNGIQTLYPQSAEEFTFCTPIFWWQVNSGCCIYLKPPPPRGWRLQTKRFISLQIGPSRLCILYYPLLTSWWARPISVEIDCFFETKTSDHFSFVTLL